MPKGKTKLLYVVPEARDATQMPCGLIIESSRRMVTVMIRIHQKSCKICLSIPLSERTPVTVESQSAGLNRVSIDTVTDSNIVHRKIMNTAIDEIKKVRA